MYPLPNLEYLIDLVSLDVRFQPLVRRFRLLRGVVLAFLLCHLPAMYRARFVPVFHNPSPYLKIMMSIVTNAVANITA